MASIMQQNNRNSGLRSPQRTNIQLEDAYRELKEKQVYYINLIRDLQLENKRLKMQLGYMLKQNQIEQKTSNAFSQANVGASGSSLTSRIGEENLRFDQINKLKHFEPTIIQPRLNNRSTQNLHEVRETSPNRFQEIYPWNSLSNKIQEENLERNASEIAHEMQQNFNRSGNIFRQRNLNDCNITKEDRNHSKSLKSLKPAFSPKSLISTPHQCIILGGISKSPISKPNSPTYHSSPIQFRRSEAIMRQSPEQASRLPHYNQTICRSNVGASRFSPMFVRPAQNLSPPQGNEWRPFVLPQPLTTQHLKQKPFHSNSDSFGVPVNQNAYSREIHISPNEYEFDKENRENGDKNRENNNELGEKMIVNNAGQLPVDSAQMLTQKSIRQEATSQQKLRSLVKMVQEEDQDEQEEPDVYAFNIAQREKNKEDYHNPDAQHEEAVTNQEQKVQHFSTGENRDKRFSFEKIEASKQKRPTDEEPADITNRIYKQSAEESNASSSRKVNDERIGYNFSRNKKRVNITNRIYL